MFLSHNAYIKLVSNETLCWRPLLLSFYTGLQSDLEPANLEAKPEESPRSSVMLTPVSEVSSVELVTLSPPQISPSSQLSETASDTSAPEVPEVPEAVGQSTESGSHADSSSTNGEPRTDEDKDSKKSKAHLHCPVCKVTVNSLSQLEAHNSGKNMAWLWIWYFLLQPVIFWEAFCNLFLVQHRQIKACYI